FHAPCSCSFFRFLFCHSKREPQRSPSLTWYYILFNYLQPSIKALFLTMPHATARVGDTIIAETDVWETVEGNIYFPPTAIKDNSILSKTNTVTRCPWKGEASYYSITVGAQTLQDAAWYYPQPYDAAKNIKDYIAFCMIHPFASLNFLNFVKRKSQGLGLDCLLTIFCALLLIDKSKVSVSVE
ncbi:hypothetical protein Egran_02239, partial [Elaphomyces granulatus]